MTMNNKDFNDQYDKAFRKALEILYHGNFNFACDLDDIRAYTASELDSVAPLIRDDDEEMQSIGVAMAFDILWSYRAVIDEFMPKKEWGKRTPDGEIPFVKKEVERLNELTEVNIKATHTH